MALSACGGSDKPAYCSAVTDFKDAVSGLTDVQVTQNGVSSLTAAVDKLKTSGDKLVSEAKSEFASETTALSNSLTALETTAQRVTDPQTRTAALVALPASIRAVTSAFDQLASAVKSKCD